MKKNLLKTISLVLVVFMFFMFAVGSGSSDSSAKKVGTVDGDNSNNQKQEQEEKVELKDIYAVGDILSAKGMKVILTKTGEYKSTNQFSQPQSGNKFIFFEFYAENESQSDVSIGIFDFECYADGYAVEQYYGGEDSLSASLSKGRYTTGKVYFEVPKDSKEIELEYETNWLSDTKVKFAYEGAKDSGFKPEKITARTENAYKVGDIVEVSDLRISYLGCTDYKSNNQFIQPASGNKFIALEFEVENIGKSDEFISSMSFCCYADGASCSSNTLLEGELSATISSTRKAKGKVSFEVPKNAEVIEVEYEPNVFLSDKVIFTAK